MALSNRQNNLFAAEDWDVAYQAYSQVNFQAYDFETIRTAMIEYIRTNFPENFNDYIESSEFIAIIELLAYLAQSIAFRMDVNTRENFLETAERRDSVFKLARQLGYNPKRNIAASGLLKIVSISTTEPLTDSASTQIGNRTITWNDANNPDAYEQFITIMNSAFGNVNRFSKPVKTGSINKIITDLYEINTAINQPFVYKFKKNINGISRDFEVVNADFEDNSHFYEKHPDPTNNFGIVHRNDGLGLSSTNNGFFLMFKQGTLNSAEFNFEDPVENRRQLIGAENINETDVYFQQVSDQNVVLTKWQKIPNTVGQTLQFNTLAKNTPLLYAIQNVGVEGIELQFADGNFANVPVGNYRAFYRVSANERYSIQPDDVGDVVTTVPYVNQRGESYVLTITSRLQVAINNALPEETLAGIKERAPQSFYAQDRMVSAQDYQVLPLAKSTNIEKLKVTNRTHAGHSRYIDITDPTSTFQTTTSIAEDGALYKENISGSGSFIIDNNNTAVEQIEKVLPLYLKNLELQDFVYSDFRDQWKATQPNKFLLDQYGIKWNTLPKTDRNDTGYLTETFTNVGTVSDVNIANPNLALIQPGHLIKFVDPNDITKYQWVKIVSIRDNGRRVSSSTTADGPFRLSENVKDGFLGNEIITTLRTRFYEVEQARLKTAIERKQTFGLGYDATADLFYIINNNNLDSKSTFSVGNAKDTSGNQRDRSWIIKFTYESIDTLSYRYNVELRGTRYIFESFEDVRFYNINENRIVDSFTGRAKYDTLELPTMNTKGTSIETFEWRDTSTTPDFIGDKWYSTSDGVTFSDIPLKTRSIKYDQVEIDVNTNFGLFRNADSSANVFVNNYNITLGTNFDTSDSTSNINVTIANNTGVIHSLPDSINIDFTSSTFGHNILDANGNISYKHNNTVYTAGNIANMGGGHIYVANANVSGQTGTLVVTNFDTNRHYALDSSGLSSKDVININYIRSKDKLDKPITWAAVKNFTYSDGHTDARKVQVTPFNSTNDDSPDNPIQFSDFVGPQDIVLFEDFNSFDGYTYTKPVKAGILDLRREPGVNFSTDYTRIAGDSTGNAEGLTGTYYNVADYEYFLVKSESIIGASNGFDNTAGKLHNKKVYAVDTGKVYLMSYSSTNLQVVNHYESSTHRAKVGKSFTQNTKEDKVDNVLFKWTHIANNDQRIDPSISNVHEMFVLTSTYYEQVKAYLNVPGTPFPEEPSTLELETEFQNLETFKSASDQLLFKSGRFKMLFGDDAPAELQARFKVVRLPGTSLSDNEIKTNIIKAVNKYFNIDNWEFGDTFYFTELSSYIHQEVGNTIGSIVIVPKKASGVFGDLFQVKCDSDELFLSTATVNDIDIVDKITKENIKPNSATPSFTSYKNPTSEVGPFAINGYYPLYPTEEAANFAGNGTSHQHDFFGKTFYMPNGITFYHGNYTEEEGTAQASTTSTSDVTNNTISGTSATSGSGGSSYSGGSGSGGSGGSGGGGSGY
tara:strand:+ start:5277 stop:9740 length:4464 start_codon:yes stop_codon:yes gene_type:complete